MNGGLRGGLADGSASSDDPVAVTDVRSLVGEAPTWDAASGTVIWVDIHGQLVHRLRPSDGHVRSTPVPQRVGSVVPATGGGLLLALEDGFWAAGPSAETPRPIAAPADKPPDARFNDGKCDRDGRFLAGTIAAGFAVGGGALYRLDESLEITRLLVGLTLSNGLAFSPDGSVLYHIDTRTRSVRSYEYTRAEEGLGEGHVVIEFDDASGHPDGMTVDSEGYLWIAMSGGARVVRYSSSGRSDGAIGLPVSKVTNCAFGGDDLGDLYITTSSRKIAPDDEPLAGSLFRCRPGVRGIQEKPFSGDPTARVWPSVP